MLSPCRALADAGRRFCLYVLPAFVCYNARLSITARAYPRRCALAICVCGDANLRCMCVRRVERRCEAITLCSETLLNLVMRPRCHLARRDKRLILPEKLKKSKTLRKGLDNRNTRWYNNQAVARSGSESVLEN